jgi:CRP/FNR family transcriptional regulator
MSTHQRKLPTANEPPGPIACRSCDLNEVCRLSGLIALDAGRSRSATGTLRTIEPGASLFRTGAPAVAIYALRQGLLKSVRVTAEGEERVLAIHTPGDVLGLEAFGRRTYAYDVIALQPVVCCEMRLTTLVEESTRVRELGVALVQLLSRATEPRLHLAYGSVRRRVTAFILDLAQRLERRGLDARRFTVGLSRQELADLLDTRIETVSRMMQRLNREGAIQVAGSSVKLLTLARESGG